MAGDDADDVGGGQDDPAIVWVDLYPVYDAPDEATAIHVQAWLRSAGLTVHIRSGQVPGFDGAVAMGLGYWGQVMVARDEVLQARALLSELLTRITEGREEI